MRHVLLVLLLAAGACRSTSVYRAPVSDDPQAAFEAILADADRIAPEDEALWQCELAKAALRVGEEQAAFRALDGATRIMGTLESSARENRRAILGAEATKTWKGDPHERAMSSLYKGLLYWRRGDLGNASACFKAGLFADGYSEAGECQQDFAVLAFLLGWISDLRGRDEQARFSFREAAELRPGNPYFASARPDAYNVLVVADIGRGPLKYADGPGGSIARYKARATPDGAIEVLVDGSSAGVSASGVDLFHQAITRGEKVIDGIRKGKAVFKAGTYASGAVVLDQGLRKKKKGLVAVGAGLLLLSALTNAEADTRYWDSLPGEVHVLPLRLAPGPHELRVRAIGRDGRPLPGWERTFQVHVTPQTSLYWFSTGRGRRIDGLTDGPR